MPKIKQFLKSNRRLALGLHVAMAMVMPGKGHATTMPPNGKKHTSKDAESVTSSPDPTRRNDFTRLIKATAHPEVLQKAKTKHEEALAFVEATWKYAVRVAESVATDSADAGLAVQLTNEEARLWLQAFNAGPYALLKYQGNVPYQETQNYVPRVMSRVTENLSNTAYEPFIQASARKYGLDPQMVRAIMKTESDFDNLTVSHAGARGLMQVMPVVWSEIKSKYGFSWDYETGVFEPEKNIEVACAYLAWLRYDFLPRHFAVFEISPHAPAILVRDHDRGVPARETARIVVDLSRPVEIAVAAKKPSMAAEPDAAGSLAKAKVSSSSDPSVSNKTIVVKAAEKSGRSVTTKPSAKGKTVVVVKSNGNKRATSAREIREVVSEKEAPPRIQHRTLKKPAIARANVEDNKRGS